jgi:hypothetical protein
MSPAKATDFPLLTEVFREGLRYGIISKKEVTAWADSIIAAEDEPDYFFIELSLAKDSNALSEILNKVVTVSENELVLRVLMAVVYHKLIDDNDVMSVIDAAELVGRATERKIPTQFESNNIYAFEDYEFYYLPDDTQLQVDIISFLSIYENFSLYNCDQWSEINKQVEETLIKEQAEVAVVNESFKKAHEKRVRIKKQRLYILMIALTTVAFGIVIFDYNAFISKSLRSKFEADVYQTGIIYLAIFVPYFMLRVVYGLWKKVKRVA